VPAGVGIVVAVALAERTQLALYMLRGIGPIIRNVPASLADGTVGEGLVVGWGGGVVSVEAASGAGGAGD